MAKTLSRELSQSPYYTRDIHEAFSKILFKPGYALQSSELIELQDIVQNQIKRLSNHVFQDGSIVYGKGIVEPKLAGLTKEKYNCHLFQLNDGASTELSIPKGSTIQIRRNTTSGVQDIFPVEFITFNDAFYDEENNRYYPDLLAAKQGYTGLLLNDELYFGQQLIGTIQSTDVLKGRYVSIEQASMFYVSGYFVALQPEDYIFAIEEIDSFDTQIGIEVAQNIITVDDTFYGSKLLDPAQNSFNANSPGADRLQLELQLNHYPLGHTFTDKEWRFYPLIKYRNGTISFRANFPIYSELGDTLARRTSEINGNFVVDDFDLTVEEASVVSGTHKITDITYDTIAKSNTITITGTNTNYVELDESGNLDPHYLMIGNEIEYHRLFHLKQISSNNEIKVTDEHYDRYLETNPNLIEVDNVIQLRNERYLNFVLDPGIAYVNGYRFQTTYDQYLERKKARNWKLFEGDDIYQNQQYFVANTVDVHFMNEGQAFQNLDYVDVHVGNKNQIHFPNTAITFAGNTVSVTANTISGNTITLSTTGGIFNTTGMKNWDYVNVYDNGGNFIEETLIYNVESVVDTEGFIDVIDGAKYTNNGYYQIEKVSSENKELALYNSTNFGKLRLHTSVVSGSETELHFSHWEKEPSKKFTVTSVKEDLANTVVSLRAKTMNLSEKDDVYNNLRIYKGEESWKIKNYMANNAYKEFELEVLASNYLNPITVGEKLELRYENELTTRGLAQLAINYEPNFKANLNVQNSRLNIQTPNGTTQRFNVIANDGQEVKSVTVNDYSVFFYDTFDIGSVASNQLNGNINTHFTPSITVPTTNIAVYSKNDILDATNTTVIVAAGEKVDVSSASVNSTNQLEITLVNTYRADSQFIVHATLKIQTPQRRSKTLKLEEKDEFLLDFDANGVVFNNRYSGNSAFTLTYPDIYRIREIWVGINKTSTDPDSSFNDMTSYFDIDNGQRDTHYDLGVIRLKPHLKLPTVGAGDWLFFRVKYEYFEPGPGHYFTVNSYTDIHYRNIPTYIDENKDEYPLRNLIDYRPIRRPLGSVNKFENEFPLYDSVDFDYEYYFDQEKVSYIHRHNQSTLEPIALDVSSKDLFINSLSNDKIRLYDIKVPAYTFDIYQTYLRMIDNRGYTMKDISKLQKRLENLEDVVQLNSLELQTLQAKTYTATGDPAFANGLLVDMFAGFSISKFEEKGFQASVDLEQMQLYPTFKSYAEKIKFVPTTDVQKKNNVLFLPKTDMGVITELNTNSSGTVSIGAIPPVPKLSLHPFCNIWYDQNEHVTVKSNEDNQFKNWKDQTTKSGHGTQWADWEQFWSGVPAEESTTSLGAPLLSMKTNRILNNKNNIQRVANGRKINTTLAYSNAKERIGFVGEMLTKNETYSLDGFTIQNGARLDITYTGADLDTLQRNYLYRKIHQENFPQNSAVVQKIVSTGTANKYYFYITNITSFIPVAGMKLQSFTGTIDAVNTMDNAGKPKVDDHGVACGDFILTKPTGDRVAVNLRYLSNNKYIIAAAEFHTSGLLSTIESLSKSIRPVQRKIFEQTEKIKYIEDQTNVIHAADDIPIPMHQPFVLAEACMISKISVDIKSGTGEFITTIRPFVNGNLLPSTILPFSEQVVKVSATGRLDIVYDVPIYVPSNQVYAVTFASADTLSFNCFEIKEHVELLYSLKNERQSSTVETQTTRRLKMDLYKAQFDTNERKFSMALANTTFDENIDRVRLNLNTLNTLSDEIDMKFEWKSKNYNSASNDSYHSPIDLNKTIQLPTRKEINLNTFDMNVSMKTENANFSPMLDLERFYMTMIQHSIDNGQYEDNFLKCHAKSNTYAVTLEEYTKVGHIDIPAGRKLSFKVTNGVVSNVVSDTKFLLDNKTYLSRVDELDASGIPTLTSLPASYLIDELYTEYNDQVKNVTTDAYRYYSPIVTLEDNFEAMQIHFQSDAILPSTTEMYVYYRIKTIGMSNFEEYEKMHLITSTSNKYSTDSKTKLLEFNTQRPVTSSRFKQFQIKIRFVSSDYVNAPTLKNIRIIALDN